MVVQQFQQDAMKLKDARHLSPDAQEALRYRVVNARENGMSCVRSGQGFQRFENRRPSLD